MFSFINCRTFKPTNFAALKNTVQYNNKCWGWTDDIYKTDNPQVSHETKKKLANPWQYSNLLTQGPFHSFFRQLPVVTGTAFSKTSKKRTTSQVYPNFQNNFPRNSPRISRIFGWKVHILEIQQFLELLGNFPGTFCTICCCFQILENLGCMESTVTMSTDIHWTTERLTDSRMSYRSVFNLP